MAFLRLGCWAKSAGVGRPPPTLVAGAVAAAPAAAPESPLSNGSDRTCAHEKSSATFATGAGMADAAAEEEAKEEEGIAADAAAWCCA